MASQHCDHVALEAPTASLRIRRDLLVAELAQRLPGCEVSGIAAGLHLVVHLPDGVQASGMVRAAEKRGVRVVDLDRYRAGGSGPPALVLGYGNITDALVPEAVSVLADALALQRGAPTGPPRPRTRPDAAGPNP